jgi:hypothetical protein
MEKYGWDKYKDEGLRELERIVSSRILADKEAQISILRIYHSIYQENREHEIKGTVFYPEIDKETAEKRASDIIGRLRYTVQEFYASAEGKESAYEIYFIAKSRDYRLGIRPKKSAEQKEGHSEIISYDEHRYFRPIPKRFILKSLGPILLFISPFLFFISVVILWVERSHLSLLMFFVGLIGFLLSVVLGYIGIVLHKLCVQRLAYLFSKYFLRLTSPDEIIIVSYTGKCSVPECKGDIFLSCEFKKETGYIAKCSNYPIGHRFTIDPITLQGKRIGS